MNRATSTTSAAAAAEKVDSKEVNSLETILQCRQAALDRWETLKKQAASRRALLEDSYRLQVFKKDERDMISWINEKMEFAIDESYKDPTNLQVSPKGVERNNSAHVTHFFLCRLSCENNKHSTPNWQQSRPSTQTCGKWERSSSPRITTAPTSCRNPCGI